MYRLRQNATFVVTYICVASLKQPRGKQKSFDMCEIVIKHELRLECTVKK